MSMIVNQKDKRYEKQSHRIYPENWNGADWIPVPPEWELLIEQNFPYYELEIVDGVLVAVHLVEVPVDLEELRMSKIQQLSECCEQTIYAGQEIPLSDGSIQLFQYKLVDQTNIKGMFDAVTLGATEYPYQSDSGTCKVYSAQDIITLYTTLETLRTGQLTYYHQLKDLVNTLEDAEQIAAVSYGQPLEGEYLEHYNQMMQVAQEQMQLVLSKVTENAS